LLLTKIKLPYLMHIAIAGNIGAGKTTLTSLLAKHYKWQPHFESVAENPYLDDFYGSMERWSFNLQIYFLNSRFRQILEIRESGKNIIQDRTIYEDANIFAPNLHAMGLMTNRDFSNYETLFELMERLVSPPDLLIYLRASIPTLVGQIHKRGRDFENSISIDYLSRLNERYEAWISTYKKGKLLIIDIDNLNIVDNQEDLGSIIDRIDAQIHGLF
jgi:deoxyadenosine/deoxycytidine kinase